MRFCDPNFNPIPVRLYLHNGVQYPPSIFKRWTNNQLARIGIYRVVYLDIPTPDGKEIDHYTYAISGAVCEATPVFVDAPPPPVPQEVEGWQAEVAMKLTFVDPEDVESQTVWDRTQDIIDAIEDEATQLTARTVLERGRIRRDSPMLAMLSAQVPLTSERVDDLFKFAVTLEA